MSIVAVTHILEWISVSYFMLMCERARLFLAVEGALGAYLVLQYATTQTMPTTSSATQMPVIVSTRFWYSSSASE